MFKGRRRRRRKQGRKSRALARGSGVHPTQVRRSRSTEHHTQPEGFGRILRSSGRVQCK